MRLTRLKRNHPAKPDNTAKRPLCEVELASSGTVVHLKGHGFVKVFQIFTPDVSDIFNYLLCDAEHLFSHCSTQLSYIVRQAPFALAPVLNQDLTVDFQELTPPTDTLAVIAKTSLTDNKTWMLMEPR